MGAHIKDEQALCVDGHRIRGCDCRCTDRVERFDRHYGSGYVVASNAGYLSGDDQSRIYGL